MTSCRTLYTPRDGSTLATCGLRASDSFAMANCRTAPSPPWKSACTYGRMPSPVSQGIDTNRFFASRLNRGNNDEERLGTFLRRSLRCRLCDPTGSAETRARAGAEARSGACSDARARPRSEARAGKAETGCRKGDVRRRRAVRLRQVGGEAGRQVEAR